MRKYLICLVLLLVFFPLQALAAKALVGVYVDEDDEGMEIVMKDDTHVRINMVADDMGEEEIFILIDGDAVWFLGREDAKANFEAVDYTLMTDGLETESGSLEKFKITKGAKQTINKINGVAFEILDTENEDVYKVVLSANKDVVRVSKVLMFFFKDFGDLPELELLIEKMGKNDKTTYGVLKYEKEVILKSITTKDYPDSYFKMPEGVKILTAEDLGF